MPHHYSVQLSSFMPCDQCQTNQFAPQQITLNHIYPLGGDGCVTHPTCHVACTVLDAALRWPTASLTQTWRGWAEWRQRTVRWGWGRWHLQIEGVWRHTVQMWGIWMMAKVMRMGVVMRCPPTPCSPTARVVPGGLSKRDCKHKWARPHQYPTQQNHYFLLERLDMHGNRHSYWGNTIVLKDAHQLNCPQVATSFCCRWWIQECETWDILNYWQNLKTN